LASATCAAIPLPTDSGRNPASTCCAFCEATNRVVTFACAAAAAALISSSSRIWSTRSASSEPSARVDNRSSERSELARQVRGDVLAGKAWHAVQQQLTRSRVAAH